MSDDEWFKIESKAWNHAIAQSTALAQRFRDSAPRCDACGKQVATPGRTVHFACDPTTLAGHRCTCPPLCSSRVWGDGGNCDPRCRPCRLNAGKAMPGRKRG